jgi:hypothetical protein
VKVALGVSASSGAERVEPAGGDGAEGRVVDHDVVNLEDHDTVASVVLASIADPRESLRVVRAPTGGQSSC